VVFWFLHKNLKLQTGHKKLTNQALLQNVYVNYGCMEKKENWNWQTNLDYLLTHKNSSKITVELVCVEKAEVDEMRSFVHDKSHQC
ncbi:MAG: hypothetical protein LBH62_01660, partial [Nitrososphaerota archaeon]|nr:hypothetical protein [Nitrososphaerota archaeon]